MSSPVLAAQRLRAGHLRSFVLLLAIAAIVGALSGVASAVFLESLRIVTALRDRHPWLLFGLPAAGAAVAWVYAGYGRTTASGNNLILDQIHEPSDAGVPLRLLPLILGASVVTHLFGGSAGREGTAVQMGGAIAGETARRLRLDRLDTRLVLMCGISGGFGSVFGTPMAGGIFGMEVLALGGIRYEALLPCLTAALFGDLMVHGLGIEHARIAVTSAVPSVSLLLVAQAVAAGVAFGLASRLFSETTEQVEHWSRRWFGNPITRTTLGGCAVVGVTLALGTREYNGLSLDLMERSFTAEHVATFAFLAKLVLTAITLGVGFKGGEVTPLFVIGATLGHVLASPLGLPVDVTAALGFVGVFAAAANSPITCVVMGVELFGGALIVPLGIATFVAYTISGHHGIYRAQRFVAAKHGPRTPVPAGRHR